MLGGIDYRSIAIAVKRALTALGGVLAGPIGADTLVLLADSTQTNGVRWADAWSRGMLGGCQLTWVSNTSLTLGVGKCRDDADTETMKLASATTMSNLTVGWVVGNNQPKVRTGVALANGMTLHAYVIKRTDTGVVDWFLTDEASNPTLPANYTKSRRVASIRFATGAQTIPQFIQDGDYFWWNATLLDVNNANPGAAAVTRTLTVPTGISVYAICVLTLVTDILTQTYAYLSDLANSDQAPSATTGQVVALYSGAGNSNAGSTEVVVRTNTSAQVRSRASATSAGTVLAVAILGWIDSRGRNA